MSNRVYKSNLSTSGINNLISQLEAYAEVDLPNIADMIVRRLAAIGIRVAEYSVYSDWRDCIEFKYEPTGFDLGQGEVIARDTTLIHRVWYASKKTSIKNQREAYISPLLMSEFGAGWYALTGHRGTFPGQRHAFESEWFWYDVNGKKHSSEEDYHMVATQPMYRAFVEMMLNVDKVAREVFAEYGNG